MKELYLLTAASMFLQSLNHKMHQITILPLTSPCLPPALPSPQDTPYYYPPSESPWLPCPHSTFPLTHPTPTPTTTLLGTNQQMTAKLLFQVQKSIFFIFSLISCYKNMKPYLKKNKLGSAYLLQLALHDFCIFLTSPILWMNSTKT